MSDDDPTTETERVRLLTVCTGNICRSPYASALLGEGLEWARPGAFEVTSAGTHALIGRPMDPGSQRILEDKGLSTSRVQARMLSSRVVERQALVLVMDGGHRELVLDEAPAAHRRTLGLLDLAAGLVEVAQDYVWADLLSDAGAKEVRGRWRALPALLMSLGAVPVEVTPVDDPYGKGSRAFDAMAEQIDAAVRTIVRWEAQFPR